MSPRTPPRTVVARITAILATFRTGSGHSVTEMARLTGLPISTTHRLVAELTAWHLLQRTADGTYLVGSALRGLGDGTWSLPTLQQLAPHVLTDLCDATGHRARMGVLVDGRVAYIEKQVGPEPVTTFCRGVTLPAHATALGKALLAYAPHAAVYRMASRLTAYTPRTHDSPERLLRALRAIRLTKLAVSRGEHYAGEFTIAVPVFAPDGTVVAALEVEVADSRSDFEVCRAALTVAAGALSRELATTIRYRHLTIVPAPLDSGFGPLQPVCPAAGG